MINNIAYVSELLLLLLLLLCLLGMVCASSYKILRIGLALKAIIFIKESMHSACTDTYPVTTAFNSLLVLHTPSVAHHTLYS